MDYPLHSYGQIEVPKVLANIVESAVGAIFIDDNVGNQHSEPSMDTAWKVGKNLLEPVITFETLETHPVSELYEVCNKRHMKLKLVDVWEESMSFYVFVDAILAGKGTSTSKKEIAKNRAAKAAVDKIHAKVFENLFGASDQVGDAQNATSN